MAVLGEDIYKYQFSALFDHVNSLIGRNPIKVYSTDAEEQYDKEYQRQIGESNLLFDISGNDFKWYKACDSEYKQWVEVYVIKIIEGLLTRSSIHFEANYHPKCNERYSIVYELHNIRYEAYFLFDIEYEEANRTDYDKLADTLKSNSHNDAKIEVYIFRDNINSETLAWLINCSKERNANGLVEVFPLCRFFEKLFSSEEYSSFSEYANEFISRCNSVISYKTVITPTQRTLSMFKLKKAQMLSKLDYKSIAAKGQSGELSDAEFSKVKTNFLNKRMYTAMISSNDFADSFISAEWAFDIYSNSMGELELTGIIAGYLKSIEQLMYTVARFHRDQGLKIRTKRGYQPYTAANEHAIDSTLNSLNEFLTSPKAKLAITRNIRGCIKEAVDTWRQYQRNGYFHKDNLYSSDNKIFEVRELTLYLYFVILGGISFSSEELQLLGIAKCQDINKHHFDEKSDYTRFCRWFDGIIMYDLPEKVPGLWLLMTHNADTWEAKPFLMKYFYIDEFESNTCEFVPEQIDLNPVREITAFTWNETNEDMIQASLQFGKLFARYREDHPEKIKQIMAIILGADKMTQLLYFRENN